MDSSIVQHYCSIINHKYNMMTESLKLRTDEYAYEILYSYGDVFEVPASLRHDCKK